MFSGALFQEAPERERARRQIAGSVLARFLEFRGRRIFQGCGALWYSVPGRFLMSLPYERVLNPEPEELHLLLREARSVGARFPSLTWSGLDGGIYVLQRRQYDVGALHVKHRPRVRHGLQYFTVQPADRRQLIDQGRLLNLATMARQGRYDPEFGEQRRWERVIDAGFACPGVSFPAIFAGSRLAAYMVTCRESKWLHILHQMSRQDYLPHFPNHTLTYAVTAKAAEDPSLETVCYGYAPLFAADGLHEYKLRFGYEMVRHHSAIQLHPMLQAVLDHPLARAMVGAARRMRRNDQTLETIETVLKGAHQSGR